MTASFVLQCCSECFVPKRSICYVRESCIVKKKKERKKRIRLLWTIAADRTTCQPFSTVHLQLHNKQSKKQNICGLDPAVMMHCASPNSALGTEVVSSWSEPFKIPPHCDSHLVVFRYFPTTSVFHWCTKKGNNLYPSNIPCMFHIKHSPLFRGCISTTHCSKYLWYYLYNIILYNFY